MCLITFHWQSDPIYKLILVANRDEFFSRPSAKIHQWDNGIYAGRDLKSGGTWMGIHPNGRFAALTNYRDLAHLKANPVSRGKLVLDYLTSQESPSRYLENVHENRDQYDGFNLFVADKDNMWYFSNYDNKPKLVSPGLHGISNALLDDPWYKVVKSKSAFERQMQNQDISLNSLGEIHQSTSREQDERLPNTGLPLKMERALSAPFIKEIEGYGTVNISAILWRHDGQVDFLEKRVKKNGQGFEDEELKFKMS
ncbi:NRDE family protein [Echinicola sp. CAU 1574]|uniref:NRDE family protein n=1 Tax=Echinicola arenosa TaxID=2774144 RepID=A0ABR9AK01_9BACT|nr:NRDE family protein [Echinicola arenosa]MBD8487939.1 NRDE family protein [Echinicola arenosa]